MHFGFHSLIMERVGGRKKVVLGEGEDGGGERVAGMEREEEGGP